MKTDPADFSPEGKGLQETKERNRRRTENGITFLRSTRYDFSFSLQYKY